MKFKLLIASFLGTSLNSFAVDMHEVRIIFAKKIPTGEPGYSRHTTHKDVTHRIVRFFETKEDAHNFMLILNKHNYSSRVSPSLLEEIDLSRSEQAMLGESFFPGNELVQILVSDSSGLLNCLHPDNIYVQQIRRVKGVCI